MDEMTRYDIIIVGSGLFGAIVANQACKRGKKVLVVERRDHIGGNCYTAEVEGIQVHRYGAHIFRTNKREIWDYMQQFCEFNNFVNSPIANYYGELYNLPFNMNTFYALWGARTPDQAKAQIEAQRVPNDHPTNLEEHILNMVGRDIYEKLVKGYTEKQWGKKCSELPASIMRRIPLRFIYDNNYFNDVYQGIPIGGYTRIMEQMLEGSEVILGVDYVAERQRFENLADVVVYTGTIDSYYDYHFGPLEYRSLRFEEETLDTDNYQGVAVMNFTDAETAFTRIIEHKHFEKQQCERTVISHEYPQDWTPDVDPYYPIEDEENRKRYQQYAALAAQEKGVFVGGRLGEYRYYDMQDTVASALSKVHQWFGWAD